MSTSAGKESSGPVQAGQKSSSPQEQGERKKETTKRRRNHLSCAECRRLKLRCDRVFPCESCRKRGCAAICPEGALTTKGTRFVLANTEELHVKIMDMSERIRALENGLIAAHGSDQHPLLREDLLQIKVPVEFSGEKAETERTTPPKSSSALDIKTEDNLASAFGTLKIGTNGQSRFFGQTARTEHFLKDEDDENGPEVLRPNHSLPPDIMNLSQTLPYGTEAPNVDITRRILTYLPTIDGAWQLIESYYTNCTWMYEPCARSQITEDVLKHVYEHAQDPEGIDLHRLGLLFAVMAHGALMDLTREPYSAYAEQLQILARASLSVSSLMEEASLVAVQALFLIYFYCFLINKKEAPNSGWILQGLNCKIAQMLGLHRDIEYFDDKGNAQGELRRKVFWEMLTLEGWTSLGLGRPPTLHFSQIDCKMPAQTIQAMNTPGSHLHTWYTWKHGLAIYVNRVLQKALDAKTPPYSEILDLDRSIHQYAMPPDMEALVNGMPARQPRPEEQPGLTMERWLLVQARYTAVLLLHRGFFAQALSEGTDPMQSKYAPSVLATYRSACFIIMALHNAFTDEPALTMRYGLYWSNAFSASIALCLLVTRATTSSYAPSALTQLDLMYDMFCKAALECYPAAKALPMATKLRDKAHAAYAPYYDGQHPASASQGAGDNDDEELNILGGKTNIVKETPSPPIISGKEAARHRMREPQPRSPGMPLQLPPTNHLDSVHPSLVQYLAQTGYHDENYPGLTHLPTSEPAHQREHQDQGSYLQSTEYSHSVATHSQSEYYQSYEYAHAPATHTSTSSLADAVPATHYAAYSHVQHHAEHPHPEGSHLSHPHQTDSRQAPAVIVQPEPQQADRNQFATWQNYMTQLGFPG